MHWKPIPLDSGLLAAYAFIALIAVGVACSDMPVAPRRSPDDAAMTRPSRVGAPVAPTAMQQIRLREAQRTMAWVGESHHEAMRIPINAVLEARRTKRPIPAKGSVAHCHILVQTGVAALRILDSAQAIRRSSAEQADYVRSLPVMNGCARQLSLFTSSGVLPALQVAGEPEITGAYEPYVTPMEEAVYASDATVSGIQSAIDPILQQAVAAGIPEADLEALGAMASIAISSATEWNSFNFSGGAEKCDGTSCNQMSMLPLPEFDGRVLALVSVDAGACLKTAKTWKALKLLLATPVAKALAGVCGVTAAVASGGALLAMF